MIENRERSGIAPGSVKRTQAHSSERARAQPGRIITIQRELLSQLSETQRNLEACVKGYMVMREQEIAWSKVDSVLEAARLEHERLKDFFYRRQLTTAWRELQHMAVALESLLDSRPELLRRVRKHDQFLEAGASAIGRISDPSQAAAIDLATHDVFASLEGMRDIVDQLTESCRTGAERHLGALATDIAGIFLIDDERAQRVAARPPRLKQMTGTLASTVAGTGATETSVKVTDPLRSTGTSEYQNTVRAQGGVDHGLG